MFSHFNVARYPRNFEARWLHDVKQVVAPVENDLLLPVDEPRILGNLGAVLRR
jgi:hypothetical protein